MFIQLFRLLLVSGRGLALALAVPHSAFPGWLAWWGLSVLIRKERTTPCESGRCVGERVKTDRLEKNMRSQGEKREREKGGEIRERERERERREERSQALHQKSWWLFFSLFVHFILGDSLLAIYYSAVFFGPISHLFMALSLCH